MADIKGITLLIEGDASGLKKELKNISSESKKTQGELKKINKALKFDSKSPELLAQKERYLQESLKAVKKEAEQTSKVLEAMSKKGIKTQAQQREYDQLQRKLVALGNVSKKYEAQLKSLSPKELQNAEASKKRKYALEQLEKAQDKLSAKSERLKAEYERDTQALEKNSRGVKKLSKNIKQAGIDYDYYKNQLQVSKEKVDNLSQSLSHSKKEFGENSKEVESLKKQLADATKEMEHFEGSIKEKGGSKVGSKFRALGDLSTKVGKKLSSTLTPAIAGVGAVGVKSFIDFDKGMNQVKKTADLFVGDVVDKFGNKKHIDEVKDYGQQFMKLSEQIPTSREAILEVAGAAAQLGVSKNDIVAFTELSSKMGVATELTAEESAVAFAQIANATGTPISKMDRFADVIVQLGNNMATTEGPIVEFVKRMAGTGHSVGMANQYIAGLGAAMASVGLPAEMAATSMNKTMTSINTAVSSGGEQLEKFASISGLSSEEFSQKWKEKPQEAILDFVGGLKKISDSGGDVDQTLRDLGITNSGQLQTLKQLAGGYDTLKKGIDQAGQGYKDGKALSNEFAEANKSLASKMERVKNKLENLGTKIGESLSPYIEGAIDLISGLVDGFNNLPKGVQDAIVGIGIFLGILGPALLLFGSFARAITSIHESFKLLKGGMKLLKLPLGELKGAFMGIITSPITWTILAIVAAVIAAIVIFKNWDKIVKFLKETFEKFKQKATEIWEAIKNAIKNAWESVKEKTHEVWEGIKNKLSEIWQGIVDSVSNIWNSIVEFFSSIWESIKEACVTAWDNLTTYLSEVWQSISESVSEAWNGVVEFLSGIWEGISQTASNVWNGLVDIISNAWNSMIETVSNLGSQIADFVSNTWESIKGYASEKWEAVKSTVSNAWDNMKNTASSVGSAIADGVSSAWENVKSYTSSKWDNVKSTVSNAWDNIKNKSSSIGGQVASIVGDKFNQAKTKAVNAANALKDGVKNTFDRLVNLVRGIIDRLKNMFNFKFRMPHIPLPHLSWSGSFSVFPPSVPHFSVEWRKKGAIFTKPTIFSTPYGLQGVKFLPGILETRYYKKAC